MRLLKAVVLLLFFSLAGGPTYGMVVTTQKMAYVDIQEVYENLIIVHQARTDLQNLIQQQKDEVQVLKNKIEELRETVEHIKEGDYPDEAEENGMQENEEDIQDIETLDLPLDTEAGLDELKNLLEEKESGLRELKESSADIIREKEQSYRRRIMGEIYDTLEDIAQGEGYTAVLDGEVIFFTGEDVVDITNRVIEELNEKAREN